MHLKARTPNTPFPAFFNKSNDVKEYQFALQALLGEIKETPVFKYLDPKVIKI